MSTIAAKLNKDLDLTGKTAAVSGGTQGIGEAVAVRFAQAGSSVFVLGRSEERGSQVIEQLKRSSRSPSQKFEFIRADLGSVAGIHSAAETLAAKAGSQGVNYLVETQGGPPNGSFEVNADGNEAHFAVQVLSRFGLAALLAKSGTLKESLTVVCAPGGTNSSAPDVTDLQLFKQNEAGSLSWGRGLPKAGARDTAVTDGWVTHFAEVYPNIRASHLFPGYVSTKAAANSGFPWPVLAVMNVLDPLLVRTPIGNTATQYANIPVLAAANPTAKGLTGVTYIGERLNDLGRPKWVDAEKEKRVSVWDQLSSLLAKK